LADGAAYPFMAPVLRGFVLAHAHVFAFLASYGELAIGLALVLGLYVRLAAGYGFAYMMVLLFASNFPGPRAPLWEYFGAALDHLVLALCFAALLFADSERAFSMRNRLGR